MTILEYKISFATPAFLGNAEQEAQWRTPPFKALIRQWWRIARAKDFGYDYKKMLAEEKYLFGTAGESDQASKCEKKPGRSKVQLRLEHWDRGALKADGVPQGKRIRHDEIKKKDGSTAEIGANLYLGYGAVSMRTAIAPAKEEAILRIMAPSEFGDDIQCAIQLANWFGTMGSRSRNGWGSAMIESEGGQHAIKGFADINTDSVTATLQPRPLEDCLKLDWPHTLGYDNGIPLVWRLLKIRTNDNGQKELTSFSSWEEVIHELACIKIAIRTSEYFKFKGGGKNHGHLAPQPRHILAYPAGTNHAVKQKDWDKNGRLANQLRFKVHRRGDGFAGLISHFPCGLPNHMRDSVRETVPDESGVWREVHRLLDERRHGLVRIKGAQK